MCESEKVSIIVTIYNAENTLERCLVSLQRQTYRDIEVLLLDDGSTDATAEICRRFSRSDERFRYIEYGHRGMLGALRNDALRLYTGRYLMFADADDLVSGNYVERLYEVLQESGCSVATCIAVDSDRTETGSYEYEGPRQPVRIIPVCDYDFRKAWSHRVVWGAIFKREALRDLWFDEQYHMSTDTLFMAELLKREGRVAHIDEPLYLYLYYPHSNSHGPFGRKRYSEVLVWEEVADRIFADGPELPRLSAQRNVFRKSLRGLRELAENGSPDTELKKALVKKIRKNLKALLSDDELSAAVKIRWCLAAVFPALYSRIRKR